MNNNISGIEIISEMNSLGRIFASEARACCTRGGAIGNTLSLGKELL